MAIRDIGRAVSEIARPDGGKLLDLGLSIRKIAKFFGYKNHISLNTYVNKRSLKDEI